MNLNKKVFVLFLGQLMYSACCASSTESTVVINTHKNIIDFNVGPLGNQFNGNKTKLIKIEETGTLLFKDFSNLEGQELTPSINNYGTLFFTTPELTQSQKNDIQHRLLVECNGLHTILITNPFH